MYGLLHLLLLAFHVWLTALVAACSSLCYQSEAALQEIMDATQAAGITVVSLPLVNQWTQVTCLLLLAHITDRDRVV